MYGFTLGNYGYRKTIEAYDVHYVESQRVPERLLECLSMVYGGIPSLTWFTSVDEKDLSGEGCGRLVYQRDRE